MTRKREDHDQGNCRDEFKDKREGQCVTGGDRVKKMCLSNFISLHPAVRRSGCVIGEADWDMPFCKYSFYGISSERFFANTALVPLCR